MFTLRNAFSTKTAVAAALLIASTFGASAGSAPPPDEQWPDLKSALFQDRVITEDTRFVSLDAPLKAEDAALVPMTVAIRAPVGDTRRVVKLTLVVDENPVPLAGTFTIGEKADLVQIATRVRVNSDTFVHLIAELSDGSLTMSSKYVHAAGGCSAPSAKGLADAESPLGRLKFRLLPDYVHGKREAVVMIRHPNHTGMQLDPSTQQYTPARYVDHFAIYQGDDLVFAVDGGISISEDPNFRFAFALKDEALIRVEASDIAGAKFTSAWPVPRTGG